MVSLYIAYSPIQCSQPNSRCIFGGRPPAPEKSDDNNALFTHSLTTAAAGNHYIRFYGFILLDIYYRTFAKVRWVFCSERSPIGWVGSLLALFFWKVRAGSLWCSSSRKYAFCFRGPRDTQLDRGGNLVGHS